MKRESFLDVIEEMNKMDTHVAITRGEADKKSDVELKNYVFKIFRDGADHFFCDDILDETKSHYKKIISISVVANVVLLGSIAWALI